MRLRISITHKRSCPSVRPSVRPSCAIFERKSWPFFKLKSNQFDPLHFLSDPSSPFLLLPPAFFLLFFSPRLCRLYSSFEYFSRNPFTHLISGKRLKLSAIFRVQQILAGFKSIKSAKLSSLKALSSLKPLKVPNYLSLLHFDTLYTQIYGS